MLEHQRFPFSKTIEEWKQVGIKPIEEIDNDILAFIFQPDGPETPAWLLTSNYRTILEYNCSNYYAMSVGLLADEITR